MWMLIIVIIIAPSVNVVPQTTDANNAMQNIFNANNANIYDEWIS